jgi:hypothetical protein
VNIADNSFAAHTNRGGDAFNSPEDGELEDLNCNVVVV